MGYRTFSRIGDWICVLVFHWMQYQWLRHYFISVEQFIVRRVDGNTLYQRIPAREQTSDLIPGFQEVY